LVLLGAGGAAAALLASGDGASERANDGQGDRTNDPAGSQAASTAALAPVSPADAAALPADAAVAMMEDAGPEATAAASDAALVESSRRRRAASGKRARPGRPIDVQVMTIPNYARLYIGNDYSGQSGTTIRKPEGTAIEVECRLEGFRSGRVKVKFDGRTDMYTCKLIRVQRCVEGIKNPFDDCPE
jgi:hypothetical protein